MGAKTRERRLTSFFPSLQRHLRHVLGVLNVLALFLKSCALGDLGIVQQAVFLVIDVVMMESMELEEKSRTYCIRGKHVAVICVALAAAAAVVLGISLGLSQARPTDGMETSRSSTPEVSERGPCRASSDSSGDWKNFRLPEYVTPVHYDLHVEPDLDTDIYTGNVSILVSVSKATRHLWLHIRETFISVLPRLQRKSGQRLQEVPLKRCFEYKPQEYVVLEATEVLPPTGPIEYYVLTLRFQGWLNNSLVGFYRTTYQENGTTKKIAATDHEPTDARKTFPCFDEPNKKATYKISITHDGSYSVLSNMPVEKIEILSGNRKRTSFEISVRMSTYLVCFAVHQFTYVERRSSRGIPLRVYVQPTQIHTAVYAANVTKVIFDYFEFYFNMTYSLPKLDKIAIPDFGTGAMENWGLITYRESSLLYDASESSSYNKKNVASIISHELVHQWFGNIVTMDWWDDLWLNEGFASFFAFVGVDRAEPSWEMRDFMLTDITLPVMVSDALVSSHAIITNVSTPAEITAVFDGISYSKGASILRMLEDLLGGEMFQIGCQKYLKDFQFRNAKTSDFWRSLAAVSGFPIEEIMDTWTKQMGYPLLDVSTLGMQVRLTQRRLLLDPNADPSKPTVALSYSWIIPIKWFSLGSQKNGSIMYNRIQRDLLVPDYATDVDGLLKVNRDSIGFYRVNYNDLLWSSVSQQLLQEHRVFSKADRAGYIDDAFFLARANVIDYSHAFNLAKYLAAETEYVVWDTVASSIAYVRDMMVQDSTLYPKFQMFFRNKLSGISRMLGWNDTGSMQERMLRAIILGLSCQMEDQDALVQASHLFYRWINGSRVAANLRRLVYHYGMKQAGSEEAWDEMFRRYSSATLAQEKDKILYGLSSVENVDLLSRLLEAAKNESIIRTQDVFTLIRYVSLNKYGSTMAWDWTALNWEYLVNRFTINSRNLGRLVARITATYNTELQLWQHNLLLPSHVEQIENFISRHPDAGAGATPRKQALEKVKSNIDWMRRNREEIRLWLDVNVSA
ncbi:glutamyl aminopeptidase-like isoform X2 [Paramormyrops kingsleyae]|uniref:glutamyl aminopeptidase-like isoform X2 n=1 Tax=Paramormyrops kingsleyae TaxID=1676925 RepID=UPI003B97B7D2